MDKNELRKIIREAFIMQEIPKDGYFQNIKLKSDKNKGSSSTDGSEGFGSHTVFNTEIDKSVKEKKKNVVNNLILQNSISKDKEEFKKTFEKFVIEFNSFIPLAMMDIKSLGKVGDGINKKVEDFSRRIKEFIKTNSPKSLSNKDVISWYQIK